MPPSKTKAKRRPIKSQDESQEVKPQKTDNIVSEIMDNATSTAKSADRKKTDPERLSTVTIPVVTVKEMDFEKMFYDRRTQQSAFDMFMKEKGRALEHDDAFPGSSSGRGVSVRSADSGMQLRSKHASKKLVHATEPGGGTGKDESEMSGLTVQADSEKSNVGMAMVNELLNRYETNKRKALFGTDDPNKKEVSEDEFDDRDLDLWDDDEDEGNSKSDFLKYTIPQFEIKDKLCKMHYSTIERMSDEEIEKLCHDVIPDLRNIMSETVPCKRHDIFKSCGLSKQPLRDYAIGKPFSQAQDYNVMCMIQNTIVDERAEEEVTGELLHYVTYVLIPEALIRIYAITNKIPIELAEKELRFGPGYDGLLNEDLIRTVTQNSTMS